MKQPIWVTDSQKNKEAKDALAKGKEVLRAKYGAKKKELGYE